MGLTQDAIDVPNGISVAMATYNGAKFLRQQLDSIAAQDRLPSELVVTDDASTDSTIGILQDFAATAPFPVFIHQNKSRLGYRANFMRAMALCRSEIIALCDQDDVWEAGKIAVAIKAFIDPEIILFFHNASLIDGGGNRIGPADILALPPRSAPLSFYPMVNPFGFSVVFRRTLIRFAQYWPASIDNMEATNRMAHDQWIFFLASVFGTIAYSDVRLVNYRQHGGNAYGWKKGRTGLSHRLRVMLRNNSVGDSQFAVAAAGRERILRLILQTASANALSSTELNRAETCADFYHTLSLRLALRAEIYMAKRLHRRALALLRLVRTGGYSKATLWNIGPRAMLKDVALGLVLRPLLLQYTDPQAEVAEHLRRDLKVVSS